MKLYKSFYVLFVFLVFQLTATEFTISTYNCGSLSDHYDYLRAVAMQKLMQERYLAEPKEMALNEKIQQTALKILFSNDSQAKQEWDQKGYQKHFEELVKGPQEAKSPNSVWNQKSEAIITTYKIRPVVIHDQEMDQLIREHMRHLTELSDGVFNDLLEKSRAVMAKQIFHHYMSHDIICLQEVDYLNSAMFPEHYEVVFSEDEHSKNGIAWNKNRLELVEQIGTIEERRGFAVKLMDKETNKTILVVSGHLSGCNPFQVVNGDSAPGDAELQKIIQVIEESEADYMLIGMDSNVTSLHPRLHLLKDADFQIDAENHFETTCTSPHHILNTRIDWIALKTKDQAAFITNIPVLNVGLNSMQTNISDHKPIAAKISY